MGSRVQNFFPNISFGYLGYRMDRTHSIMRIATTASPVSGADVRDRTVELLLRHKIQKAVNLFSSKYAEWRNAKYGVNLSRGNTNTPLSEKSEGRGRGRAVKDFTRCLRTQRPWIRAQT
eukprot:scaffold26129_cov108-Skeletonema_marinoi.AAC.1